MISTHQAIEAIKTIKEYCEALIDDECMDCPIYGWCKFEKMYKPEGWQIPQKRTEK